MSLGDLIVEGDDLYGDGVNPAARLEGEAPVGGILISRRPRQQTTSFPVVFPVGLARKISRKGGAFRREAHRDVFRSMTRASVTRRSRRCKIASATALLDELASQCLSAPMKELSTCR